MVTLVFILIGSSLWAGVAIMFRISDPPPPARPPRYDRKQ